MDANKVDISQIAENILRPWIKDNEVNLPSVILIGAQIVEEYTLQVKLLAGKDAQVSKLQTLIDLLPPIIDILVKNNALSAEKADELKIELQKSAGLIKQIVEMYILISKNPQMIQFATQVEESAKKCWAKCKNKNASKKIVKN